MQGVRLERIKQGDGCQKSMECRWRLGEHEGPRSPGGNAAMATGDTSEQEEIRD